jgi:uncharacterized protein (TIGR04255 family)
MSNRLFPFAGDHAVQSAAFAIEWQQELTASDAAGLQSVSEELRSVLPMFQPSQAVVFQMGPQGGVPQIVQGGVAGFTLSRPTSGGGVSRLLELERQRCVVRINDYTRWHLVWPEVQKWFNAVGSRLGRRNFTAIGLQYNDVFHWRDQIETFDPKEVFREGSPFIPANATGNKNAWHSHHGYFETIQQPTNLELNENINVNIIDNFGRRSVNIATVHRAKISLWEWAEVWETLGSIMEVLHDRNKKILSSILNDEVTESIHLNSRRNA